MRWYGRVPLMTFTWPWALLALLVIPLAIACLPDRAPPKRKFAVSYASPLADPRGAPRAFPLAPARARRAVAPERRGPRPRDGAPAGGGLGAAQRHVDHPHPRRLAFDVLDRRCSQPLLSAAQAAARKFVDEQPAGTRIGIVAFAGLRADHRSTDDRRRQAQGGHRQSDDVGRHRHRQRSCSRRSTRSHGSTPTSRRAR